MHKAQRAAGIGISQYSERIADENRWNVKMTAA